jgi:hypothetical protein
MHWKSLRLSGIFCLIYFEVIAKPRKIGAKPMGQNVHAGCKTSNGAAQAAPAIVNCPLSIVNFLGFAITSRGFATGSFDLA